MNIVGQWAWYNQLFLFGGAFILILGIATLLNPLIQERLGIKAEVKSPTPITVNKVRKLSRLEHDGVLWEDGGWSGWGISVTGPLCPKDLAVLGTENRGRIESNARNDITISDSEYHSRLVCPECNNKYTLSAKPKTIEESRKEVRNRFEGKRRREQDS